MTKPTYPNLMAEMGRHGDTTTSLAEVLGVSLQVLHYRITGKTEWKIGEIDILCKRYNTDYETLFKRGE